MSLLTVSEAAAKAQILAQINAGVSTSSDGGLVFNDTALRKWMSDQVFAIADDPANASKRTAIIQAAGGVLGSTTDAAVSALSNVFKPARWAGHPKWPLGSSTPLSGADLLNAAKTALANAASAVTSIESYYESMYDKVAGVIQDAHVEFQLSAKVPEAKERVTTRIYYVYTYVTDWGEESAPSPVSDALDVDQDDEVSITIDPAPTGRYITKWRFYASAAGSTSAAFQFLAEDDVGITTGKANPRAMLGEVCPTATWLEPPEKLQGLTGMPNGVMAGFYDNVVCFCEPYTPYAWPIEYQMTTAHPVTAMAAFGQTLVVSHYGGIDYMSGADSASISAQKDVSKQSCASHRSMVPVDGGVIYASPDGLCLADASGVRLITQKHFSREDWQALQPASMIGAYHEGTYYFTSGSVVYAMHLPSGKLTTMPASVSAFYQDPITDGLYGVAGNTVVRFFSGANRKVGTWRSKLAVIPGQQPFAWLAVESDFAEPVTVRWYGDGELRHEVEVSTRAPVRLPAGRYLEHEVEIESQATLNSVTLASSTQELQAV